MLEKWFVLFSLVTMSTISIICSLCFIHVMSCITSGKVSMIEKTGEGPMNYCNKTNHYIIIYLCRQSEGLDK